MGGFGLDMGTPENRFVLTPSGVAIVLQHAPHLLEVSDSSITDRSKANSITKAFLVWQVLYFCVSCIARHLQSLPISLFEISTLAHCICTLITCAIWWKKPLDIGEPTNVSGSDMLELVARLQMLSPDVDSLATPLMVPADAKSESAYKGMM